MSKPNQHGRAGARANRLGVAAALAAATFLSGVGSPVGAQAAETGAAHRPVGVAGGTNGIYHSPELNYAVPNTFDGTSLNLVTGAFDDTGPTGTPWDQNFWASSGALRFFSVSGSGDLYVVSGTAVAALHAGDTIGPDSTFQTSAGTGTPAAEWLAGTDAYAGFKFTCDGRLANPVAGGVCYGYVHLVSGATSGFPATIVDYAYDGDGNPISIGPVETFTVTPSVGTPSGTIAPAAPQTVNSGATTSFTLAADAGFHVDTVGGTCGGTLAGNVYTTSAITADCTVIANFAAGEGAPAISATPSPIAITVDAGATETGTLTVTNTGGGTLTYSIADSSAAKATSYRTAHRARAAMKNGITQTIGTFGANPFARSHAGAKARGETIVLDDLAISQMQDNTPVEQFGVSCPQSPNSWWRRFYFSEHAGVGASANVASVTIASEAGGGAALPLTINLYTIAHSTDVDTIPTAGLTLIGSATGTIEGDLQTVTIPVTGAIDDTAGKDLVVEWHTDNPDALSFYPGANDTAETHPTFMSSDACGTPDPTPAAEVGPGFPDFHLIMVVNLGDGTPPATCDNPVDVPWLSVAPATGSLAGGASADSTVTVDASTLAAGSYSANLCVSSNDTANPLLTIPVSVTVAGAPPADPCAAADTIFCDGFDGSAPAGDVVTGTVNLPIDNSFDGNTFDFVTGQLTPYLDSGDLNLYNNGDGLAVYWYADVVDGQGGFSTDGASFDILQSGATIGPDSPITDVSVTLDNWWTGADGYLGVKFMNEETGAFNYGYLHITTTSPDGFPTQVVDYGYDKSGAAITIP